MSTAAATRLMLITPPRFDVEAFAAALPAVLAAGDVACVQIRVADPAERRAAAARLIPIVQAADIACTITDDVDLARSLGADGVHLEAPSVDALEAARAALPDGIVGVSAGGSRHDGIDLAEAGADYVSFGPCFASTTVDEAPLPDLDPIRWWTEMMTVPSVAIGGITAETAGAVASTGADFIAVSGFVWSHPRGPAAAVAELMDALTP